MINKLISPTGAARWSEIVQQKPAGLLSREVTTAGRRPNRMYLSNDTKELPRYRNKGDATIFNNWFIGEECVASGRSAAHSRPPPGEKTLTQVGTEER